MQVLLANEHLDGDVSLTRLAERTGRFSGSDLRALCTAAAMRPVRELLEASGKSAKVWNPLFTSNLPDALSHPSEASQLCQPREKVSELGPASDHFATFDLLDKAGRAFQAERATW